MFKVPQDEKGRWIVITPLYTYGNFESREEAEEFIPTAELWEHS